VGAVGAMLVLVVFLKFVLTMVALVLLAMLVLVSATSRSVAIRKEAIDSDSGRHRHTAQQQIFKERWIVLTHILCKIL
jgi:hypothetical protein